MSWHEYHRKTAALGAVLERAASTGQVALPYEEVPEAREVFASEAELLAALEAKWSTLYRGFLEQEAFEGERTGASPAAIARSAWTRGETAQPALRRLIDHNSPRQAPVPTGADRDVRLEASGNGGRPFPTWSTYVGEAPGPTGVAAELGMMIVLILFGFVLWSL